MFVLLLGRWLGGLLRHERTPSPAPTPHSSVDSTSNIVYFVEEVGPSTSSSRQEDSGSTRSSRSGTIDLIADSCYDTPASSPIHVTRNFFDNSFQHPILDFRDYDEPDESYFDTLNCADPSKEVSCELLFVQEPKTEAVEKTCSICKTECVNLSTQDYTNQLPKEDLLSFVEAFCDGVIESASQSEFNEIEWPERVQEDVCKDAEEAGSARMSVELELNNEPAPQTEATITNLLPQRCGIAFDANQAAHAELLKEDNLSPIPNKVRVLSSASSYSSYSSDDESDSSSNSRSCVSNLSSIEDAL